jgi:hypothetical protein
MINNIKTKKEINMKRYIILLALFVASMTASAQDADADSKMAFEGPQLVSVGVGFSYFNPSFDYWKDRTSYDLKGSFMPSLFVDASVLPYVNARLSVSYFQTSAEITRLEYWGSEKLSQTIMPLSLSIYAPLDLNVVTVYAGGGIDFMAITSKYVSPESSQKGNGNTTGGHIMLGAEHKLDNFIIGIEGKYMFGKFNQTLKFSQSGAEAVEAVKLNGPAIGLNFKYAF